MKKLYFVRHGVTDANVDGVLSGRYEAKLLDEGRQQARATGKELKTKHQPIDLIICSPQHRALETAQLIAKELRYPLDKIETNPLFMERSFGVLEGTPADDFLKDKEYQDFDTVEGAETIEQLHQRAEQALAHIKSLSAHNILLVSHGSFGRSLWRVVNRQPHTAEYEGERMHIQNAEIVELI